MCLPWPLVLCPASGDGRGLLLQTCVSWDSAATSRCDHPGLEAVRGNIPAARALPLLQALAGSGAADLVLEGLSGMALQVQVQTQVPAQPQGAAR